MIARGVEYLEHDSRLKNCRVQSLCDLLLINWFKINPQFVNLSCFDTMLAFAEVTKKNIILPFASGFCENLEERFLNEHNIQYAVDHNLLSVKAMSAELKAGNPFMVLCDANSILRQKINVASSQVGVCSGITIIGYNSWKGKFIFSQHSKNGFPSISSKLLLYARSFDVLPSSPENKSIKLLQLGTDSGNTPHHRSRSIHGICPAQNTANP